MDFGREALGAIGRAAAVGLMVVLAGCSGASDGTGQGTDGTEPGDGSDGSVAQTMTITGVVQDEDFQPVAGASVHAREMNMTTTTGGDGAFVFDGLPVAFHTIEADATDLMPQTLTARPGADAHLLFTLARFAEEPYHQTTPFHGIIRCAAEYLIITPSCDSASEAGSDTLEGATGQGLPGGGDVVEDESAFPLLTDANWKTIVVDVSFQGSDHPGLDGLRTVVQGTNDPNELGSYQQYGRFHGQDSYSFRIEPGQEYPEGDTAVPANATGLIFNVYPQSHGWHATCEPPLEAGPCFLGLGAGVDVEFDLYVTAFYVDPAPEGWSLL